MSLINEALRKSTRQPTPFSHIEPPGLPFQKKPKGRLMLWASLGIGGLLCLLIVLWIGFRQKEILFKPQAQQIAKQIEEPTPPSSSETSPSPPLAPETALAPSVLPTPPAPQVVEPPPAPPKPTLILNGVATGGGNPFALINNRIVEKGEEIEGYVLKEIFEKKVILEKEGKTLEVRLQ